MQHEIKELYNKDNLTQKDIIQLLLHNAQHMVTRDELKEDNRDLKADLKDDINELDKKIDSVKSELKDDINKLDKKIDSVKSELKNDINELDKKIDSVADKLDKKIDKVSSKFDRLQWFMVGTILTVLFKEYILKFFSSILGQ